MTDTDTTQGNLSQKIGGWFGKVVTLIFLVGLVAGGLMFGNHYLNRQPAYSSHSTPAEVVAIKVFDHKTLGEIGIPEITDGPVTGPLMSDEQPAVDITTIGDWKGAKWIKVDNNRSVLGFMVSRPVVGKDGKAEKHFPAFFWALKRG